VTEGLGRALAWLTQPIHRPWSPSGRRRGSEVPVPRPRAWRSAAARLPVAAAGWAKSIDPLLRHEVEDVPRLGSFGYQTGPSEPQLTTSGRATCTKWLMSTHQAECHDVALTPLTRLHSMLDAQLANTRSYDMHTVEVWHRRGRELLKRPASTGRSSRKSCRR